MYLFFIRPGCVQQAKEANATSGEDVIRWLTADRTVQIRLQFNLGKLKSLLTLVIANKHSKALKCERTSSDGEPSPPL